MISLKFQEIRADKMNDSRRKLWLRKLERKLWIIYLTVDTWINRIKFKLGFGKVSTFEEFKKRIGL